MATITKAELRALAQNKAGARGLNGYVNETRMFSATTSETSLFLSHSHKDRDIVEQAKIIFEKLGISIYVDWADEEMPIKTNGITASNIKKKIFQNDKFVFLGTNDAVNSKWCNWEIGIGDTYKYTNDKIAILGIADNNRHWEGNEYLQIYPRIEYRKYKFYDAYDYFVIYPNNTSTTLKEWLQK
jgi:hypothetical protein